MNKSESPTEEAQQPVDEQATVDSGLCTFTAEFFTDRRTVRAELISPEMRLSDYLNSSTPGVELRPLSAIEGHVHVDLSGSTGHLTKGHILFVVPLKEPHRPVRAANAAWKPTVKRRCWAGLGPYTLNGTLHVEQGHDPAAQMRLFNRQFVPLTEAEIRFPDGSVTTYGTIIVNRFHLDLVAIKNSF